MVRRMSRRTVTACALIACAFLFVSASPAAAQDIINQILHEGNNSDSDANYHAPSGRWLVHIPYGMSAEQSDDPNMIVFSGHAQGVSAQILIKRVDVEAGAASAQLMLETRDNHLKKLPNFTVLSTRKAKIAGRNCAILLGRYDYQGNKAYPLAVEQAYVIDGSDGFVIGLEVPLGQYNDMQPRMKQIYESFQPLQPAPPKTETSKTATPKATQ